MENMYHGQRKEEFEIRAVKEMELARTRRTTKGGMDGVETGDISFGWA
jgi:hypothetical protein